MKIKLDNVTEIPTPNAAVFASFYPKFYQPLVDSLNHGFCLADREDAVEHAFYKLMYLKDAASYNRLPRTEADCFYQLRWQARSYLSHLMERADVHAKYVEYAAEMFSDVFTRGHQGEEIDADILSRALVRSLEMVRREQDISRRDLDVCLRIRKDREPAESVAKRHNITANNAYVIASRVTVLLRKYGPACFERALCNEGHMRCGMPEQPFAA